MKGTFFKPLFALFLLSCGQNENSTNSGTIKEGNKSTTISTDTAKLSKLIDFKVFKPTNVKFKYVFIDNSGKNERLSVPGPSDNYLQAVLYFDSATFQRLKKNYFNTDYVSPNYDRRDFDFDILDTDTRSELLNSDTNYHGHPDFFLGLGAKGKLWFLNDKVLLAN